MGGLLGQKKEPEISDDRTESATESAELKAQMTGEGPVPAGGIVLTMKQQQYHKHSAWRYTRW